MAIRSFCFSLALSLGTKTIVFCFGRTKADVLHASAFRYVATHFFIDLIRDTKRATKVYRIRALANFPRNPPIKTGQAIQLSDASQLFLINESSIMRAAKFLSSILVCSCIFSIVYLIFDFFGIKKNFFNMKEYNVI